MQVALVDPSLFTLPYDRALMGGLSGAGHEVTLYARRPGPEDGEAGGIALVPHFYRVAESRTVRALPGRVRLAVKGLDHAASMLGLLRRLRAAPPDVIHFQWLPLPLVDRRLLPAFRAVAPLVLTVHDTNPFNGDPSAGLQQRGFFDSLALFDRLIVHTAQGRERLVRAGLDAARIAVLPHGLLLTPPARAPDPMQGPLSFLLFGKIKPYKGLDVLIDAFAALPPALRTQARLHVVGKPYMDLAPLLAQAERCGVALTLEPRFVPDAELPALFGPGVIAVFPYREIEASGVLSIAMACARPIVASRLGNFAETITEGREGHLVPPGDAPALTSALARLLADRDHAAACSAASRQTIDAVPGWTAIGRQTAAVYDAVTGRTLAAAA